MDTVDKIVQDFQDYRGNYNINSVVAGLLLYLSNSGLGGGGTEGATESKQDQLIASLNTLLSENATDVNQEQVKLLLTNFLAENATEAKQDSAIALLAQINGDGTPQTQINDTATTTAEDIAPANSDRRILYLHNNSDTNTLILNFGNDANLTSAIYRIQPEQTLVERSTIIKLRISGITSSGVVDYSYLEVL